MKLIDTHAHLEQIDDLEEALKRAKQAGLEAIVGVGSDHQANRQLLKICADYAGLLKIYPALGIHPGNLEPEKLELSLKFIQENINRIVAIGEIGLDYWYKQAKYNGPDRELQRAVFKRQLGLAEQYNKPVIVHSRGSWQDCLDILAGKKITKVLFHWYSGPENVLQDLLKCGYFISATPSAEYSPEHKRAIGQTPIEHILLETDSPVRYKPEAGAYDAQPKDLLRTLQAVAEIKSLNPQKTAEWTRGNAITFFGL